MPEGVWEPLINDWPSSTQHHRAIHMILLRHEEKWKVLAFGIGDGPRHARTTLCYLFELVNDAPPSTAGTITNPWTDLFCAGHCHLENGDLLFAGGGFIPAHYLPSLDINRLDLSTSPPTWVHQRSMNHARWYPTCTIVMEGQVVISSGMREYFHSEYNDYVALPELFDPVVNVAVEVPTNNRHNHRDPLVRRSPPWYPWMFINLGGGLIEIGGTRQLHHAGHPPFTGWYDTTHWHWHHENFRFDTDPVTSRAGQDEGSAVIFEPGKYMRCGGFLGHSSSSTTTAVLDITGQAEPP